MQIRSCIFVICILVFVFVVQAYFSTYSASLPNDPKSLFLDDFIAENLIFKRLLMA